MDFMATTTSKALSESKPVVGSSAINKPAKLSLVTGQSRPSANHRFEKNDNDLEDTSLSNRQTKKLHLMLIFSAAIKMTFYLDYECRHKRKQAFSARPQRGTVF